MHAHVNLYSKNSIILVELFRDKYQRNVSSCFCAEMWEVDPELPPIIYENVSRAHKLSVHIIMHMN
jgi:hypothetical protein